VIAKSLVASFFWNTVSDCYEIASSVIFKILGSIRIGSRRWPFRVALRNRSHDHLIPHTPFPICFFRYMFVLWCSSRLCSWSLVLFVMYTTQLSTLISSLSLNHHLYAADTQLFFSFHPRNFDSSVAHIPPDRSETDSSRMSANLLTLNSSKTEFLIIGLQKQLSKIDNSSLNTTHSARNLGFIFDENLTFSDQISSLSKSCYSHIQQLRCIRPYLDSKTASTIAASIVHSELDYCNSVYYNLPKCQINRLQQIQNCLACTVVKAPKSSQFSYHTHPQISALAQD